MKKYQFLGGAAFIAAASLSIPVYAQSSEPAENEGGIAEIIVTARKTSESLQTTPVAVSALSETTRAKIAADATAPWLWQKVAVSSLAGTSIRTC